MELNEYQQKAMKTCMPSSENFSYMFLNLVGEVGEFASKVAKAIRKEKMEIWKNDLESANLEADMDEMASELEFDEELMKEAGDILWQLAGLCWVRHWDLGYVAKKNLEKLQIRKENGTIDGSGDGNTAEEGRVK